MRCPRCDSTILPPATSCGCATTAAASPASAERDASPPPVPSSDDFMGRMIPTGNKPALIAYYVAFLSLLPALGVVFGIVAVIFGVKGVRLEKRYPAVRGGLHAWFGILVGGLFALIWTGLGVWMLVGLSGGKRL